MASKQQPQDASEYPEKGVKITKSITIDRPVDELYAFWHDETNLPAIFGSVESVQVTGDTKHWMVTLPGGMKTEFDLEIYTDVPNEVISWRSLEGSDLQNAGSVRFRPAPANRGTEVQLTVQFIPPAGVIGQAVVKLFGEVPQQYIGQYLREFKQQMETGEIATIDGQTSGREEKVEAQK